MQGFQIGTTIAPMDPKLLDFPRFGRGALIQRLTSVHPEAQRSGLMLWSEKLKNSPRSFFGNQFSASGT